MRWRPSPADHHDRDEECGDPDCGRCIYATPEDLGDPDFDMPPVQRFNGSARRQVAAGTPKHGVI